MGKITTVFLLFLSFILISFDVSAAGKVTDAYCSSPKVIGARHCGKVSGNTCIFGVEQCSSEPVCTRQGGHWTGASCSATPIQSVRVSAPKCSGFANAEWPADSDFCKCKGTGTQVDLNGPKDQCAAAPTKNAVPSYDDQANCQSRGGWWDFDDGKWGCSCKGDPLGVSDYCNDGATAKGVECADLTQLEKDVDLCISQGAKAAKDCNEAKASDSGLEFSQGLLKTVTGALVQKNANTGNSASCAEASMVGATLINSMNAFKTTCEEHFATCKQTCQDVSKKVEDEQGLRACKVEIGPARIADAEDRMKKLKAKFNKSKKDCLEDAAAGKNDVENLFGDLARSSQAGAVCECKKTTNGQVSCDNIPLPTDCLPGGKLYGQTVCDSSFVNCSLGGKDYATVACQCLRDSTMSICKTTANVSPANFAGVDAHKPSSSTLDPGANGGSPGSENFDLGGFNQARPGSPEADPTKSAANAGLSAGGGGGGSGGGGSAPNADVGAGGAAAGEGGEGSGGGGLFGQLKSAFGFGGGAASSKTGTSGGKIGATQNPDLSKWLAGKKRCMGTADECRQFNGPSRDIFDIMKDRFPQINPPLDPYLK